MEISAEDYLKERNEETLQIKDMSIEQIKARILDYETQVWKIKARQQSCFAVIQEDERKRSVANEMKNIVNKDVIISTEKANGKKEKEVKETLTKLEKQIKSWRGMKIPEEVVRKLARTADPDYLFPDEKMVKKFFIICPEHGKYEITKDQYSQQVSSPGGWACIKEIGVTVDEQKKEVPVRCGKESTFEEMNQIVIESIESD
jgi:hypothetical protein